GVVQSHRFGEADHREFGSAISQPVAYADDAADRCQIDDDPVLAGDHLGQKRFADVKYATHVHSEQSVEVCAGSLQNRPDVTNTGVVNDGIDLPLFGFDFGFELSATLLAGNVQR